MFLEDLEYKEKMAFLELATIMVSADGKITIEEREMLRDAQEEMGLEIQEDLPREGDRVGECCRSIAESETRAKVLLELASFAYVDSDYDVREEEFLRVVAKSWQFDDLSIIRIEEWAHKRVKLALEAAEILLEADIYCSRSDERSK